MQEDLADWTEVLDSSFGEPIIVNESGTWAYYSMTDYNESLKCKFSAEEWEELKEICMADNWVCNIVPVKFLYNTGEMTLEEDSMVLKPGEMQYGPYATLQAGRYKVCIKGEGLNVAEFRCTT